MVPVLSMRWASDFRMPDWTIEHRELQKVAAILTACTVQNQERQKGEFFEETRLKSTSDSNAMSTKYVHPTADKMLGIYRSLTKRVKLCSVERLYYDILAYS